MTTSTTTITSHRARALLVVGVALSLLAVGWALSVVASNGSLMLSGAAVVALVLGARHAFDADHVATIDDCSRLLVQRGDRPVSLGLFFALGHSAVVLVLSLAVAFAAHSATESGMEVFGTIGGTVAALLASTFLITVGLLNLRVLGQVRRARRRDGSAGDSEVARIMASRGVLARVLGRRRSGLTAGWQLVLVGVVFGLGLETASEVALLGLSAHAASGAGASIAGVLALPLLFAGGMALFDTLNCLFMVHMYSSSNDQRVLLRFNIATTAVTAAIALAVGSVYAAQVMVQGLGAAVLAPVAGVADHFETIGYVIVSCYLAVWTWSLLASRAAVSASAPIPAAIPAAMSMPEV